MALEFGGRLVGCALDGRTPNSGATGAVGDMFFGVTDKEGDVTFGDVGEVAFGKVGERTFRVEMVRAGREGSVLFGGGVLGLTCAPA